MRAGKIQALAPESIIEYIKEHWLPVMHLWSAVHREGWTVFHTNMLVEAYVYHINFIPSEADENL